MTSVYILRFDDYEDQTIIGVFATREAADVAFQRIEWSIEDGVLPLGDRFRYYAVGRIAREYGAEHDADSTVRAFYPTREDAEAATRDIALTKLAIIECQVNP